MNKLNKIVAGVTLVVLFGIAIVPTLGSTPKEVHSGTVDNDSLNLRASKKREGGMWNYGVGSTYVWSYYQHKRRLHKSSVRPGYFADTISSGWRQKGTQSRASAPKAKLGNAMFYNVD
ncbi:lactococcin 972 family bacteriocin [Lactobacillus xylocopicola]|uniref:Lactococcin 972 family bacteriocin n=1 Tax=Lactobacillus xylocopicola TaxID=2976676 RepID=A0ABM8BHZ9_9LACO|nr:lactococcin 972 family bacteriocin [Lactobacillus xylocopicola]BDR60924.1 hypothetical protein KIM322_11850 [Lactobacillus xylocopicola]